MFGNLKLILSLIAVVLIGGAIYQWHYLPMNELEDDLAQQVKLVKAYEVAQEELYLVLYKCQEDSKKAEIEALIEGIGDVDENITIDFSNITY